MPATPVAADALRAGGARSYNIPKLAKPEPKRNETLNHREHREHREKTRKCPP